MKYLCLVVFDEQQLAALSTPQLESLAEESMAYDQALRESGHLLLAQRLQSAQTATTLRVRNRILALSNGPFAQTEEQLGRFLLIDAFDLNDAIQLAAKIPLARIGSIEIRPIEE